ncbi:hypothetical protein G3V86_24705, partial [Escherichia coli]|nr:hypothetical protein [Escherichia coli]
IEEGSFNIDQATVTKLGVYSGAYDGYIIITDQQSIKVGVNNSGQCCEQWGAFTTPDDVTQFEGSELIDVTVVDTALNATSLERNGFDEGGVMYVNLDTSVGILQLTAYNRHNGYYGHEAIILSKQLSKTETL